MGKSNWHSIRGFKAWALSKWFTEPEPFRERARSRVDLLNPKIDPIPRDVTLTCPLELAYFDKMSRLERTDSWYSVRINIIKLLQTAITAIWEHSSAPSKKWRRNRLEDPELFFLERTRCQSDRRETTSVQDNEAFGTQSPHVHTSTRDWLNTTGSHW